MDDRLVYITQTYDYLPGPLPSGWSDIKPVWFDASNCWTGEVPAPQEKGAFVIESEPWRPNVEGRVVDAVGVSGRFSFVLVVVGTEWERGCWGWCWIGMRMGINGEDCADAYFSIYTMVVSPWTSSPPRIRWSVPPASTTPNLPLSSSQAR